jgi:DNA-binding transcriptional ArsR family regulator
VAVASVDLLLHPVRLRILQAFLGGRELTTGQLADELPDLPKGGLYRHVALLADGGVLTVVGERPVRGAVERTYALSLEQSHLTPADMAAFSPDEHAKAFGTFAAALMSAYERYLAQPDADPVRDGVSYSMNALWLSDEEYAAFLTDVAALIRPRMDLPPAEGRRRRLIASAFLPLEIPPTDEGATDD